MLLQVRYDSLVRSITMDPSDEFDTVFDDICELFDTVFDPMETALVTDAGVALTAAATPASVGLLSGAVIEVKRVAQAAAG